MGTKCVVVNVCNKILLLTVKGAIVTLLWDLWSYNRYKVCCLCTRLLNLLIFCISVTRGNYLWILARMEHCCGIDKITIRTKFVVVNFCTNTLLITIEGANETLLREGLKYNGNKKYCCKFLYKDFITYG